MTADGIDLNNQVCVHIDRAGHGWAVVWSMRSAGGSSEIGSTWRATLPEAGAEAIAQAQRLVDFIAQAGP